MSPQASTATQARKELLGRLGLPPGSQDDALEETHQRIADFLDTAPDDLRGWADKRQAETDRAFHLLTGPEDELAKLVSTRTAAAKPAASGPTGLAAIPVWARWVAGLVLAAAVIVGVYYLGLPKNDLPAMTEAQTSAPQAAVDEARIGELMGAIQTNPQDTAALIELGTIYLSAGDFANADTFYGKVLEYDANNEAALVGSGVAAFNNGKLDVAEEKFLKARDLYPNNAEVHYDLGFLYMTTGRMAEMKASWEKVVEIAPDSEYAKIVQSHVGAVKDDAPSVSGSEPATEAEAADDAATETNE